VEKIMQENSHPIQPLVTTESGVVRFKENRIVNHICEVAEKHGTGMNELARMDFSKEDREQFAQLIGYSASGFCTLSYVQPETILAVDKMMESGGSALVAENVALKEELRSLKDQLRPLVSSLFNIHPDDLN
jgi:hypothetical protein